MAKKRQAARRAVRDANQMPVVRESVGARKDLRDPVFQEREPWLPTTRYTAPKVPRCDDCRALTAFHSTREKVLRPAQSTLISFNLNGRLPPAGKRAVIELVTAMIAIPPVNSCASASIRA